MRVKADELSEAVVALPETWTETRLGEICLRVSQNGPDRRGNMFRYIDLASIDNQSKRILEARSVAVANAPSRAKQIVQRGDVVFSTVRVYLENIAVVPAELDGAVASTAFCVLRPVADVDPRFLYYFVISRRFVLAVNALHRGNSPPSVQDGDIRSQTIPIAPPREQLRIASRIDEVFSRIDEGERALERAQKLVERYRQSVLKAAVTGELTREWREKHKGKLESGEALLTRILKARRAAWEKAERDKMKAKGQKPADDGWKRKYREPSRPDTTQLPELPEGWIYASLDMLADVVGGITVDQKRGTKDCEIVPYLRVANVQRGHIDLSEIKTILAPRDSVDQLRLAAGDILFNEGGDIDKLGRGWIWHGQLPVCIHQNHVFRARLYVIGAWNKIISWYGNVLGRQLFMDMGKQTTNLASISLSKLKVFPVPLMSELEVNEVVSRVEDILSVVDKLLEEVSVGTIGAGSLRQAILSSAFSGQLVPQEPTDEPASILLERIAAERGTTNAAATKRSRKLKQPA